MNASKKLSGCEQKFAPQPLDLKSIREDGCFEGYASLFGKTDLGGDIIMRGAFSNSLKKRGAGGIRMLFQHDPAEPVGVWREIYEDHRGLFVRGQLLSDVRKSQEILALMREGALDGLSIGFRTIKGRGDKKRGVRHLHEVDLWEISIVTFPMLQEARIDRVKKARLPTKREFERWLVRDAGLTRSAARALLRSGYESLVSKQDAADQKQQRLIDAMHRAARMMKRKNVQ